jgi:hypothetical protein
MLIKTIELREIRLPLIADRARIREAEPLVSGVKG